MSTHETLKGVSCLFVRFVKISEAHESFEIALLENYCFS